MSFTYEIPILVSSDTTTGAYNVSSSRSQFDVDFPTEIIIPHEAKNITVEVSNATIWYTSFNISSALGNNKFYLDVSGDAVYTVTINDGLYDLSGFAHAINVGLVNQGLANSLITFTGDPATQKVVVNFTVAGLRIDFTGANNCREILGFNSAINPVSYTTGAFSLYADNSATFNNIDYFLLHSNIVSGGIPVGGKRTSVIARVLIDTTPGNQIIYSPNNPTKIQEKNLAGRTISSLHFWLTDQTGTNQPDQNNEDFSILLIIKYQL